MKLRAKSTGEHTAASNRLNALDGWRAVACLLVLFTHTGFWLHYGPIAVWGFTGVYLFFVLSGYLLFRPFCQAMRKGTSFGFRNFYIRRFLRIYPAYFVALLAYTAARHLRSLHPPSTSDLISHLLMVFNSSDQREFFGINAAFWTLSIEAQFYILLPLLSMMVYLVLRRRPRLAMFGSAALFLCLGVVSRAIELHQPTGTGTDGLPLIRYHTVFSFLDLFACGMLVAAFESVSGLFTAVRRRLANAILAAGIAMFLLANSWRTLAGVEWYEQGHMLFLWLFPFYCAFGAGAILFVVVSFDGFPASLLRARPLVYIGKISYSVYLFHILVQLPMFKRIPLTGVTDDTLRTFLWGLISLGPALVVATIVYYLVEAPFLRLAGRFKNPTALPKAVAPDSAFPPILAAPGDLPLSSQ